MSAKDWHGLLLLHHNHERPTHCDTCVQRWPCDTYDILTEYAAAESENARLRASNGAMAAALHHIGHITLANTGRTSAQIIIEASMTASDALADTDGQAALAELRALREVARTAQKLMAYDGKHEDAAGSQWYGLNDDLQDALATLRAHQAQAQGEEG